MKNLFFRFFVLLWLWDYISASEIEIPNTPPASFSPKETLSFLPQVPKVNLITGEYCDEECDLTIAGAEPLYLNRFYSHFTGIFHRHFGHWRINPEALMLFNFEAIGGCQTLAAVGEKNSSFFLYEKRANQGYVIDASKNASFTNLSGQNHPLNTSVSFNKGHRVKAELFDTIDLYWWEGIVKDGSGRIRVFKTDEKQWPQEGKKWPTRTRRRAGEGLVEEPLAFTPPFQAKITEERQPNGNILYYEYVDTNGTNPYFDHALPTFYVLKSIKAYSKSGVFLGSIEATYEGGTNQDRKPEQWFDRIIFSGSDGRKVLYTNQQRNFNTRRNCWDTVLNQVEASGKPTHHYEYRWERAKDYCKAPFMYQELRAGKCLLETEYALNTKKVAAQYAPIGPQGKMVPIACYQYGDDHTVVLDGENNKIVYRYNADKRITAIEKFQGEELYSTQKFTWEQNTGNLLKKTLEDASGKIFSLIEYTYDEVHNPIVQKMGSDTLTRTFSKDGLNLVESQSDQPGREVKYHYVPATNLLSAELVYDQGQVCKRSFYFYDPELNSVCIKTIVDDGKSIDPNDLQDVTYRKIVEISPKRSLPCMGLPEEISEKTLNHHKEEILLKKIRYSYHPSGKVSQEDHYDAQDVYRFSITYAYDEQERLIETTNPLGDTITYSYDTSSNLIKQTGPRSDQVKEWVYDLANRPIQEEDLYGTVTKAYDNNSHLISQIDEGGFETRFEYDSLGRLIAIIHPDGGIEKRAYDVLGNVTHVIDPNGYETCREYNFRGQPLAIYHPDGTEEQFTYHDNNGTLSQHIDRYGIKKIYSYDLFDHPIQIETYASDGTLMKVEKATFSPFHKLSETDVTGATTCFTYDFAGRKISEKKGDKALTYSYDCLGRLSSTQRGESIEHLEYDLLDRVAEKRIEDLQGNIHFLEKYAYDQAGNRTHLISCEGTSETRYDPRGQPVARITPEGHTTTITYDYQGPFTKIETDPKGVQKISIHDARRRLTDFKVKNPSGEIIQRRQKHYDPAGNLIEAVESIYEGSQLRDTIVHNWLYGPSGRIEKVIEAGKKETGYLYDSCGRLQTLTKPDGEQIHRDYDGLSRLARYFGRGLDYHYTYDKKSRLIRVEDKINHTTTDRFYDLYDHLTKEKLGSDIMLSSSYDPFGKRKKLTLPDGSDVTYNYHGPYLYSVSRKEYTYAYSKRNQAGKPTQITLPHNLGTLSLHYDAQLRWKELSSPYYHANYAYDAVGNLTKYAFKDPLGSQTNTYTYDALNQLISENSHTYQYDSLYNRTSKDKNPYKLNSLCQVTHDGQREYVYDKNGNLISDGEATYQYDLLDRLIKVTKGGKSTTFTYDPFNRRLSKNDQLYIWDGQHEIGMSSFGWVRELRVLGEGLGAEIGAAVLIEAYGFTYVPLHDHQGSLVTLLYTQNRLFDTMRYTAFGEELTQGNYSPWHFASKRLDTETGLVYFGRRYYSPSLGRWITADPQGFKDGPNLYAYVKNTPLTVIDLYGEKGQNTTSISQDCWDFWYRLEGAGHMLRDLAFHTLSRIGGWSWSSKNALETHSFKGEWPSLSWKNARDYPSLVQRTFFPYNYDLKHLPSSSSSADIRRAEGAAALELFSFALPIAHAVFGAADRGAMAAERAQASMLSLTSREVTYSGYVGNTATKGVVLKESPIDLAIKETLQSKGMITSRYTLSASEALEAGEKFLGSSYKEIGRPGRGVFRSNDGFRQFRIDTGSLEGSHAPGIPHVHLEIMDSLGRPYVNNHIPFYE